MADIRPVWRRVQFDRPFINVLVLSFAFMGVFVAFQTASLTEVVVLRSWNDSFNETGVSVTDQEGYWSLATIYATFTLANWVAPSIVEVVGVRISLMVSALCYALFIAMFYRPLQWIVYTCSALVGLAAAVLWTAQGKCLTVNSNQQTISRNASLFWSINMSALLWGNLFVYWQFQGATTIAPHARTVLTTVLLVVCLCGIALMLLLRNSSNNLYDVANTGIGGGDAAAAQRAGVWSTSFQVFLQSCRLFVNREMLLFMPVFAYTGLVQSTFSVLLTSIGSTEYFGTQAKGLVGIGGAMIGVGEIVTGILLGVVLRAILARRSKPSRSITRRSPMAGNDDIDDNAAAAAAADAATRPRSARRDAIVLVGAVIHLACFYLIYANFPDDAPLRSTHARPALFTQPSVAVAILCAFLIGLGDCCWQTQIMETLSLRFALQSAPAFALFKFAQSLACAVTFVYSSQLHLQWQLLIIAILCCFATMSFFVIDRRVRSTPLALAQSSSPSSTTSPPSAESSGANSAGTVEAGSPPISSTTQRRGIFGEAQKDYHLINNSSDSSDA